jgi:hypothetical protein
MTQTLLWRISGTTLTTVSESHETDELTLASSIMKYLALACFARYTNTVTGVGRSCGCDHGRGRVDGVQCGHLPLHTQR